MTKVVGRLKGRAGTGVLVTPDFYDTVIDPNTKIDALGKKLDARIKKIQSEKKAKSK